MPFDRFLRTPLLATAALCALHASGPSLPAQVLTAPAPKAAIRRFEVGGQATDMRTGGCFQFPRCNTPQFGLGAGAAFNANAHLALDASFNILPGSIVSDGIFTNGSVIGGRATEFLAGARDEVRSRNYGFFLEA